MQQKTKFSAARFSSLVAFIICLQLLWLNALAVPRSTSDVPELESKYKTHLELRAQHQYELENKIRIPRLVRGDIRKRQLALTFDDGPHSGTTQRLLEILKKYHVRATFFVVGKMVDKYPELAQLEVDQGHEIANHTYHHFRFPSLTPQQIEDELVLGRDAIKRATRVDTRLFRPPGGEYDRRLVSIARKLGYLMVLWTADPGDYRLTSAQHIEELTLQQTNPGGIILLHDGIEATLEALPRLIQAWRKQGFSFVTCSEMANQPGATAQGGPKVIPFSKRAKSKADLRSSASPPKRP